MAHLTATYGPLAGRKFPLGVRTVIGRATDCGVRLSDLAVSRHHACVSKGPEGHVLEDMGSGNGTYLNQERLDGPALLHDDDVIRISRHSFAFSSGGESPETSVTIVDYGEPAEAAIVGSKPVQTDTALAPVSAGDEADEILKAHARLRTIVEIGAALQTEFNLPRLMHIIMERLFDVFPQADRGFILLAGEDGVLRQKAARTRSERAEQIAVSRRILKQVAQERMAIISADASADQRFSQAQSIVNMRIRSMMSAPILAQGELFGVIHVDTMRQSERFGEEDLDLLIGVATQAALAIANAKMHERLVRRHQMERDLELASQMQNSFLPSAPPQIPRMRFAARYQAAMEVGGDFYDFIPQGENRMLVAIGDVAGKGVRAALLMARMMSELRLIAMQEQGLCRVAASLNEDLCGAGMEDVFVTLLLASVDAQERTLTLCNAAHCPPFVRRAADGRVAEIAETGNFPLGVVKGHAFDEETCRLHDGDLVCLVTDGILEAMNEREELYGERRLRALLAAEWAPPEDFLARLNQEVERFAGGMPQSDDLTCVCFCVDP